MSKVIHFIVPGKPKAKARPRFAKTKFGVRTFTPKDTLDYEQWVRTCWMEQSGDRIEDDIPITLSVQFYFPIPESFSAKKRERLEGTPHYNRIDIDNCIKSILDGTQGYVFKNDSRIYKINAEKRYSSNPRTEVTLEVDV